ncbi:hypothetical protein PLESTB_001301600 [Pleodorina starrii]|uniref:Pseudouridine synthase RsuA/RluA-like domain-containing protein n=1 Tax=Pleodorina starrii TaxID=330485 RepID=A0A9W6BTQ9_9CHLO|nr:hypothetical protein PLESTB_001301600 [Pleodorina starrii]
MRTFRQTIFNPKNKAPLTSYPARDTAGTRSPLAARPALLRSWSSKAPPSRCAIMTQHPQSTSPNLEDSGAIAAKGSGELPPRDSPSSAAHGTSTAAQDTGALPQPPPPPPLVADLPSPSSPTSKSKSTRYPFPLTTLESALALPPLEHQVGAHVAHLVANRDGPASEVLAEMLDVPQELMLRLIWFGAVYYCPVAPLPPGTTQQKQQRGGGGKTGGGKGGSGDGGGVKGGGGPHGKPPSASNVVAPSSASSSSLGLSHEKIASIQAVRQAALAKWGRHSKHQTPRRLSSDTAVSAGGYLRAHCHPKRFPVAHEMEVGAVPSSSPHPNCGLGDSNPDPAAATAAATTTATAATATAGAATTTAGAATTPASASGASASGAATTAASASGASAACAVASASAASCASAAASASAAPVASAVASGASAASAPVVSVSLPQWAPRLLAVAADYVVVNKPAGLQVPPTVDNVQESLLACVEKALSLPPGSLAPAHRLDAGTEGVVVLSRNPQFATYFRGLMAHKEQHSVRKQYRCLVPLTATATTTSATPTATPAGSEGGPLPSSASASPSPVGPPLGRLVHWVLEDQREAGEVAHTVVVGEDTAGAARCELGVEQVERVRLGSRAMALWGVEEAAEVRISLITGRTHQIRVQMAALGLPLLGDRLYGALAQSNKWRRSPQAEAEEEEQQQEQGRSGVSAVAAAAVHNDNCDDDDDDGGGDDGEGGGRQKQKRARRQVSSQDPGSQLGEGEGGVKGQDPGHQVQSVQSVHGVAVDWCLPALQQPLAPLALQAHSLTVLEDGPMGAAPAVFCAGEPWWRWR